MWMRKQPTLSSVVGLLWSFPTCVSKTCNGKIYFILEPFTRGNFYTFFTQKYSLIYFSMIFLHLLRISPFACSRSELTSVSISQSFRRVVGLRCEVVVDTYSSWKGVPCRESVIFISLTVKSHCWIPSQVFTTNRFIMAEFSFHTVPCLSKSTSCWRLAQFCV
jgi:hypothetical protein